MASVRKPFVGQLDVRIHVIETIETQNEIGEQKISDKIITCAWAHLVEGNGNEDVDGKIMHRTSRSFIVRYRREIEQKRNQLKVKYNDQLYDVTHVKLLGRKQYLELQCVDYE